MTPTDVCVDQPIHLVSWEVQDEHEVEEEEPEEISAPLLPSACIAEEVEEESMPEDEQSSGGVVAELSKPQEKQETGPIVSKCMAETTLRSFLGNHGDRCEQRAEQRRLAKAATACVPSLGTSSRWVHRRDAAIGTAISARGAPSARQKAALVPCRSSR